MKWIQTSNKWNDPHDPVIFCLSMNTDPKELKWFHSNRLKKKNPHQIYDHNLYSSYSYQLQAKIQ